MTFAGHKKMLLLWRSSVWIALLILVVLPIISFLVYGFFSIENGAVVYEVTIKNYTKVIFDPVYRDVLMKTLVLSAQVACICFALGYIVALFIWRQGPTLKYILIFSISIPLMMSYIIKIYSMRGLLGQTGFLNKFLVWSGIVDEPLTAFLFNLGAVKMTLVFALVPFCILTTFVGLERIPTAILNAARDLGASGQRVFWRIILPLSLPSAIVGGMFTFVLSVGDFLAPELVGGVEGLTFGRLIFSQFGIAYNWPLGAALSFVLLIISFVVIVLAGRVSSPRWMQ